jgi:hypothetical protein
MESSEIVVVSGLPRSGTSLMMQMLAAGGVEPLTDRERVADESNPRGYFEYEAVKRLKSDVSWLPAARGKALKVVSQHLLDLPATERYRVIWMRRDLDEILASQAAMIRRGGGAPASTALLKSAFSAHVAKLDAELAGRQEFARLDVDYSAAIADPAEAAAQINAFLGGELDEDAMVAAVDPDLYRNRLGR